METKLLEEVTHALKSFPDYWDGEKLLKHKVIEALRRYDEALLEKLLANDLIKETYAIQVGTSAIFKIEEFVNMLRYKNYWDHSYTKYSNEIGLTSEGRYLKYNSDVVLDFPHKDCVLEGGMTKDEVGKQEIYYHQILAKEELDVLLSPKVFNHVKKYDENGMHEITEFQDTDNLVIKGNNLIALYTLKEKFAGKVKLIYIDPPYNTEGDSFRYNDRFNRSTWLTFMKNRLEIAEALLNENGVIAVQCSFHEYAYLKVLMDNIFGADKNVVTFNCLVRHPDRSMTADKEFNDVVEYILIYSKSSRYKLPKRIKEKVDDDYVYTVEVKGEPIEVLTCDSKRVEVYSPDQYRIVKGEPSKHKLKTISIRGSLREKNSSGRFYVKHLEKFVGKYEPMTLFKVPDMGDDGLGYRWFHLPKEGNKNGTYFQGMPLSSSTTEIPYPNFLDFVEEYNRVNDEGGVEFRNGKKPEKLLAFFIQLLTSENDLVLDFFAGSATTAAVAHKLKRQYIAIEQLDYIKEVSVPRLQKVIEGEQSGISEEAGWKGGGSFVYAELHDLNQAYVKKIQQTKSEEELYALLNEIKEAAYLNFKIEIDKVASSSEDFAALPLKEKKDVLMHMLDMNQLYLSYSEIDDAQYGIDEATKQFNHSFYRKDVHRDE